MKNEQEIVVLRRRLLAAWKDFAVANDFPFQGTNLTARELHWMSAGAAAFADAILELPRPENLKQVIEALEKFNSETRDS